MNRQEFLQNLYQYCEKGQLELRALPRKHRVFIDINNYQEIDRFCKTHKNENVYFAVATRNGGGTKAHIAEIPAVWVDIDFKDLSQKEAQKKIKHLPLRPTFVVNSGHGFHVYYALKEAYHKEDIPAIEQINKNLAVVLNGDLSAIDASRILRLPETLNVKTKPFVPVKCIHFYSIEYDLSDFEIIKDSMHYNTNIHTKRLVDNYREEGEKKCPQVSTQSTNVHIDFTAGHRDNSLFHVANHLVKGKMPINNIKKVLYFLASKCSPVFEEKEIIEKIKSALKRADNDTNYNLTQEIRDWIVSTPGVFLSTDVQSCLQLSTRQEKKTCSTILSRFVEEGLIERYGEKRGCFRLVETDCDEIDYMNVEVKPLFLNWPIGGLENMVELYPGNIAVIAGEPNAGKSAFMLSFVEKNMKRYEIYYFSSEMGNIELRKRLLMFENLALSDWKFFPKERTGNFEDVIQPNAINIIDYLELHDNFYLVSKMLKSIHDKLKNGIALVALQKNRATDFGLGGMRGLEKPRLYLSISSEYPGGRLKIVKAKNWATTINPNHYAIKFKLHSGCYFIPDGEWELYKEAT